MRRWVYALLRRHPRIQLPGFTMQVFARTYLAGPSWAMGVRDEVSVRVRVLRWHRVFGPYTICTYPLPPKHPNCRCRCHRFAAKKED